MSGPLDGIKVVECAHWIVGPMAGVMLGDLGADVIKVEERSGGDRMRGVTHLGSHKIERNWLFESYNRNKKSMTLDVSKGEGKKILYELVKQADIFLTNFTDAALKKLGLDFDTIFTQNPRIVYAQGSGWGSKGPLNVKPAFDTLMAARAGFFMQITGVEQEPFIYPGAFSDVITGITLVPAILAALLSRQQRGQGQKVEVSGLGSLINLQIELLTSILLTGKEEGRQVRKKAGNPLWNLYRCGDARWIALAMPQSDRYWSSFCEAMGIKHLEKAPKFENYIARSNNAEELVAILDDLFLTKSLSEWVEHLGKWDLLYGPVQNLPELVTDPQVLANDYIIDFNHPVYNMMKMIGFPYKFSDTPLSVMSATPELGQNTEEILLEMGYEWEDIARFRDAGVI